MRYRPDTGMSEDDLILVGTDVVRKPPIELAGKSDLSTMVIGYVGDEPIGAKALAVS